MLFDKGYVLDLAQDILTTDSPSGFTKRVMNKIEGYAEELELDFEISNKGTGVININVNAEETLALCVHIDTLGLMVSSIKSDGNLGITPIGGLQLPTVDAEYCKIYTRSGKIYTGTVLSNTASSHVYKEAENSKRTAETMHIRLDELVKNMRDVLDLGIEVGDYICIDPKTVITDKGFIKSRFLDDKLSVAIVFGVLKHIKDNNITPRFNLKILFSCYEEVGHGLSHIPEGVTRALAIDMGCIGGDLTCTEYDVSICAKDSFGPYDYEFISELIKLSKENSLNYAVDVYPFYSSDIANIWRAGNDIIGALIGPGIHASHGMERSHYLAVENTMKLITAYIH